MKNKNAKMTKEEKELLRKLMEDDELCKKWDFFKDLNWETPPPEKFMVNQPKRRDLISHFLEIIKNLF